MRNKLTFLIALLIGILMFTATANAAETFAPGSSAAYFVDNTNGSDSNAGTSASAPLKTLGKANSKLKEVGGGTIVICGKVEIASAYTPADVGGAVTYTSVWNGVDYQTTNNARLIIGANMAFSNDTFFKNIKLSITTSSLIFSGRCNNFGFCYDVTVVNSSGSSTFTYPSVIGGWNNPGTLEGSSNADDYSVHIYSGTWESVSAGHRRTSGSNPVSSLRGDVALIIKGGTFGGVVYGTGMNVHTNRFYMQISDGTFKDKVVPIKRLGTIDSGADISVHDFSADVFVQIKGGTFNSDFRLAESTVETTGVTKVPKGDATVVVTGGTFSGNVYGYGVIGSVLIKYDESVLASSKVIGFPAVKTGSQSMSSAPTEKARFANPIGDKQDPYVMEKDGIYYYCFASGETVNGTTYPAIKVAAHGSVPFGNLSTQCRSVFNATQTSNSNVKKEYWAPEIHYFDAATVGSANAGWYIYFAADDGSNENHRMYVLRATEPENPFSDYKLVGKISDSTNKWAIDGTVLQHGGKLYFLWSGWPVDSNGVQNIYIAQMSNPWTISSSRVLLSTPEYSWEKHGDPDVNEGPQILKAPDGTVHVVYSASGSWDQYYCYGVLTLTGSNPLNASHWYKATSAKFSSGNGMYGPGHGTFVKDSTGEYWMIYHANQSLSIPSGSSWWAERNVYAKSFSFTTMTLNGVSVKYPSFGSPAAHNSTQYIYVRTADYHKDGDHLYSPLIKSVTDTKTSLIKRCYICEETTTVHTVNVPTVTTSKSSAGYVQINCSSSVSGSGYIIYRATSKDGTYKEIGRTTSSSFIDKSTERDKTYYYKAKQYKSNAYGTNATYGVLASSASSAASHAGVGPDVAIGIYYDGIDAHISWDAISGAEKYRIFKRVAGTTDWDDELRMTAGTSYVDADVTAGETYEYSVQAWYPQGDTYTYSPLRVYDFKVTNVSTPTLTAKNTLDGISITLSKVSEAEGYKIYRSTDGKNFTQIAKITELSYEDKTAVANTKYYYNARAYTTVDGISYSVPSASIAIVRIAPVDFNSYYESGIVYLSWDAVKNASNYRIFRKVSGEAEWDSVSRMTADTSYTDDTVAAGKTYEYAVQAWIMLEDSHVYGPLETKAISIVDLSVPTPTVKASNANVSITASTVSNADGYKFYRSTDGKNFTQIAKSTEPTFVDKTNELGKVYYYSVRAYKGGTCICYSDMSESVAIIRPAAITPSVEYRNGAVTLSWTASKTAEKYRIFRRLAGETEWDSVSRMTANTSYTDSTVSANTTYEYAVQDWTLLNGSYNYGVLSTINVSTTTPSAPVLTVSAANTGILLTCSQVSGATRYIFFRSEDGVTFKQMANSTSPSYLDTSVEFEKTYYYKALVYTVSDNVTSYSDYCDVCEISITDSEVPVPVFAYTEISSGNTYDAIIARAGDIGFTVLERQYEYGKIATLKEIPNGSYVYCVYGDFIIQNVIIDETAMTATVPYENADALIFANEPIISYGDVNTDGTISMLDIVKTLKHFMDNEVTLDIAAANMNGDLVISLADVLAILNATLN